MSSIKYISQNKMDTQWGLTVASCGHQKIHAGEEYPPKIHNQEYLFNPEKGRILSEFQLLYIVEGKGRLVTRSSGLHEIKSGDMFIIFPGEWHSYAPDKDSGWDEYWIGFNGTNINARVENGFFSKQTPIYHIGYNEFAVNLYSEAISTAKKQEPYFQQLLAGIVNHLLGILFMSGNKIQSTSAKESLKMVNLAKATMIGCIEEEVSMPEIAQRANVSYTTFRRQFKEITGLSPIQYFINLRIQKAKEMLLGTNASIKEIAILLHFESPEYFATLFKKKTGVTPQKFRTANE